MLYLEQSENQQSYQKSINFQFSKVLRNQHSFIAQKGLVAKSLNFNGQVCCVCEPAIPKIGLTKFSFKIIECGWICVGVCQIDLMKQQGFSPFLYQINHGCYLIGSDGFISSHHQANLNQNPKSRSFKFGKNDVIIINVEGSKITWCNDIVQFNQSLQLTIEKELYPCVVMMNSVVEIIN